jgi:hypothetical protein
LGEAKWLLLVHWQELVGRVAREGPTGFGQARRSHAGNRGPKPPDGRSGGQIVCDIDLRDGKFSMPETAGLAGLMRGITVARKGDEERLRRGDDLLDDLFAHFSRKGP